ncbi:hypothetical protein ACWIID_39160 [Streptomyces phaeochromogenes]
MSIVITAGQRGDSPQFEVVLGRIRVPRLGSGRPCTRPRRVRADKAYASRKNRATCADVAFAAPSRTRTTRPATEGNAAPAAAVRRSSTRRTTRLGIAGGLGGAFEGGCDGQEGVGDQRDYAPSVPGVPAGDLAFAAGQQHRVPSVAVVSVGGDVGGDLDHCPVVVAVSKSW